MYFNSLNRYFNLCLDFFYAIEWKFVYCYPILNKKNTHNINKIRDIGLNYFELLLDYVSVSLNTDAITEDTYFI